MTVLLSQLLNLIFTCTKKVIQFTLFLLICGCIQTNNPSLTGAVSLISGSQKVIISAPRGFCVDQRLADKSTHSITLFIINCVKIKGPTGFTVRRRPPSAILTATVIDYDSISVNNISDLEEILTKKPGINYLSKSNDSAMIKVHRVETDEYLLLFLIEQRAPDIGVKQSNYFWRSFFFAKGKLIAMTASNFSDDRSSQLKLKKLLIEFSDKTKVANAS